MSAIGLGWLYVGWGAVLFETNYGLMQQSPIEIKERLLKALDKEYNVLDMATVLEVVTILERTPITKEALETTRLGRDINELRRKTKNEFLAKRAKDLVRRWRDLIIPHSEAAPVHKETSQQNGATHNARSAISRAHPISPATSLPNSDKSSISPVLSSTRVEAVPKTHAANKRLRKEITSPSVIAEKKKNAVESSPELPSAKRAKTESQTATDRRVNGDHYDSVGSDCEIVSVTPAQPKLKNRKKAPKDRTQKDTVGEDIVKEKIASIARIPKVKTTKELLAGLKSRSGGDAPANCVLPVVDHDIARNKTEHIARFLRSQSDEVEEVIDVESQENENGSDTATEAPTQSSVAKEEPPVMRTAEEILSRLPPLDLDAIKWDETPVPSPVPHEVTSEEVDRVLNEHIEGLNGNYDERGDQKVFREWHEVVSRTSYNSEPLCILPYVVID
ncbi:unnamed protein product [Nezara viridula]|uniref:Mediator of RNA polymerase II transcription subunit 26 n=1 Tax=Nezara viridula TaxID=85310 RepID=A0A9P0GUP3_NEZVI|nr:unnamed protein product [Nezara viridula]